MSAFPYESEPVDWKRPAIDKETIRRFSQRSDLKGLGHCLGILVIQGASATVSYLLFARGQWAWLAVALYVHGGILAFNPYTHELSHGSLFKTRKLNAFFKRLFGFLHWTSNNALYSLSHKYHHRYTLHRKSEGEDVHPRPEFSETLLASAVRVVDLSGLISTIYDRVYSMFVPFSRNPRRSIWQRYIYAEADEAAREDVRFSDSAQFLAHVAFALFAIAIGKWFLIVVVSLPAFYGCKWYHTWVHDTMHVGCTPETDDFRACCRTVRLDPLTSFLYWHMEWHAEHHTYPGIPCYNLKAFHKATREHWDAPVSLVAAWRDMNRHSARLVNLEPAA
jgi:fatty acid desaturase